jgi:hypothetical protein
MASTYTSRLKLERQASGENSGNWGNLVNYVLNRIDSTVRGYIAVSVAGSANVTLVSNTSTSNTDDSSTDDQVHNKVIEFTGVLTGAIHVFTDAVEGDYTLFNNTTGSYSLTFANTGHAANGVAITQGSRAIVYTDGSTIYDALTSVFLNSPKINENVAVTSTATELNILDGVTATAAELNYSDLATLGTTAASKVFTADANNLTTVSGAVANVEDTLTDGATITWDVIDSPVAKVTLGGNRTLSAPSGTTPIAGQFISLTVIQDATGSRTLTWNSAYEFTADTAPTLTTTASKADLFVFKYNGTVWLEVGKNLNLSIT